MNSAIKLLKDSRSARWIVLLALSIPMFASYFFDDLFTTISHIFQNPQMLDLGWSISDYGFYGGAYSLLCVWGGLVICGMLLDKWGVRITGSLFVGLMVIGSIIVVYAISESFSQSALSLWMGKFFSKPSLALAYAGCAIFGLGSEIAGVAVTRSIAKWFKGKEMALAMGLQLALARLGTATALIVVPRLVNINQSYVPYSETSKPAVVGLILMSIAIVLWGFFVLMDSKFDKQTADEAKRNNTQTVKEDKFKFSDIFKILGNKHFILVSLLCVLFYDFYFAFYECVFPNSFAVRFIILCLNLCFSHRVSPLATLSFLIRSIVLLEFGDNKAEIVNFSCFRCFIAYFLQFMMQKSAFRRFSDPVYAGEPADFSVLAFAVS